MQLQQLIDGHGHECVHILSGNGCAGQLPHCGWRDGGAAAHDAAHDGDERIAVAQTQGVGLGQSLLDQLIA